MLNAQQLTAAIRPQNVGQILDTSIRLYRRNFWSYLGIVALLQLPVLLLAALAVRTALTPLVTLLGDPLADPTTAVSPWSGFVQNGNSIVSTFVGYFISAALSVAVAHALLGESMTLRAAYTAVRQRLADIIIFAILALAVSLMLLLLTAVSVVTCIGPLVGLGAIIAAGGVMQLAIPVMMLERVGPWQAIVRAWSMYRRRFWPVTWTCLATGLFQQAVVLGIQSVVLAVLGLVVVDQFQGSIDNLPVTGVALATFALTVIALFAQPVTIGAMTVLYFDLRVRQDGIDIALAALPPATLPTGPVEALALAPASRDSDGLARRSELTPLLLLGLLPFGLFLAFFALIFLMVFLIGLLG